MPERATATLSSPGPISFTPAPAPAVVLQSDSDSAASLAAPASTQKVQEIWAETALRDRLRVLALTRALLAEHPERLTAAISPELSRNPADTLAAEVLPLLAACRFLERNAARILGPRHLGRRGRPAWLPGVRHTVERVPHGRVLIIGPGNYPLLLPGVQALQALAAGNTVTWKPGRGGEPVARVLADTLTQAGLPAGVLTVTGESAEAATETIATGVDFIALTGSAATGRAVLHQAAETLTPVLAELSGSDAVVVLPDADLDRVTAALAFGMRLNGSATCMAPRRLLLVAASTDRRRELLGKLTRAFAKVPPIALPPTTAQLLRELLDDARGRGATLHGELTPGAQRPFFVTGATPDLRLARTDLFAPVLTLIDLPDVAAVLAAEAANPYALTCAVFGHPRRARVLAQQLRCGTVLINDLISPTADPRVPFGGRRESGFGVTRGAEGLLAMTAVRVLTTRAGSGTRHFQPTNTAHESLFHALCRTGYAGSWSSRLAGARALVRAARNLGDKTYGSSPEDS